MPVIPAKNRQMFRQSAQKIKEETRKTKFILKCEECQSQTLESGFSKTKIKFVGHIRYFHCF